jgi:hypothetical protein
MTTPAVTYFHSATSSFRDHDGRFLSMIHAGQTIGCCLA